MHLFGNHGFMHENDDFGMAIWWWKDENKEIWKLLFDWPNRSMENFNAAFCLTDIVKLVKSYLRFFFLEYETYIYAWDIERSVCFFFACLIAKGQSLKTNSLIPDWNTYSALKFTLRYTKPFKIRQISLNASTYVYIK